MIGLASPDIIRELGFAISLIFNGWILIFGELAWVGHLIKILKTSKSSTTPTTTTTFTTNTKCLQADKELAHQH